MHAGLGLGHRAVVHLRLGRLALDENALHRLAARGTSSRSVTEVAADRTVTELQPMHIHCWQPRLPPASCRLSRWLGRRR